jgi:hypothetical protein
MQRGGTHEDLCHLLQLLRLPQVGQLWHEVASVLETAKDIPVSDAREPESLAPQQIEEPSNAGGVDRCRPPRSQKRLQQLEHVIQRVHGAVPLEKVQVTVVRDEGLEVRACGHVCARLITAPCCRGLRGEPLVRVAAIKIRDR